jgi:hypothetical protein
MVSMYALAVHSILDRAQRDGGRLNETRALLPGFPRVSEAPQGPAAADWVWHQRPRAVRQANRELFAAHFVLGQEPDDPMVVDEPVDEVSIDCGDLHAAIPGGGTLEVGSLCESIGRESVFQARLRGWLLGG